jgi:hypothetical protein
MSMKTWDLLINFVKYYEIMNNFILRPSYKKNVYVPFLHKSTLRVVYVELETQLT